MNYSEKLRDPRWQKKRLKILERDNFTCLNCNSDNVSLSVHHKEYIKGSEPWEYSDKYLVTLCQPCHDLDINVKTEKYSTWKIIFDSNIGHFIICAVKMMLRQVQKKDQKW